MLLVLRIIALYCILTPTVSQPIVGLIHWAKIQNFKISIQEYDYSEYEDELEELESGKPTLFRSMEGRIFRGQSCEYIKLKDVNSVTGCEDGK